MLIIIFIYNKVKKYKSNVYFIEFWKHFYEKIFYIIAYIH